MIVKTWRIRISNFQTKARSFAMSFTTSGGAEICLDKPEVSMFFSFCFGNISALFAVFVGRRCLRLFRYRSYDLEVTDRQGSMLKRGKKGVPRYHLNSFPTSSRQRKRSGRVSSYAILQASFLEVYQFENSDLPAYLAVKSGFRQIRACREFCIKRKRKMCKSLSLDLKLRMSIPSPRIRPFKRLPERSWRSSHFSVSQ